MLFPPDPPPPPPLLTGANSVPTCVERHVIQAAQFGSTCLVLLVCELFAARFGAQHVALVLFAWTGEQRVLCRLAQTHRALRHMAYLSCDQCINSSTARRRLVRPPWCRDFVSFVEFNRLCNNHAKRNVVVGSAAASGDQVPNDTIATVFVNFTHWYGCVCEVCLRGLASGYIVGQD
jgi:hypothetical protein